MATYVQQVTPAESAGLSPELRMGRMEQAAFVMQPVFPIFLQEQRPVEIDETGLLRQQDSRCHG